MKSNFNIKKKSKEFNTKNTDENSKSDNISEEEFEDYVSKAGASGTFMVFRSKKKDDELGIDEL